MPEGKDEKAQVNPAARHDAPTPPSERPRRERTREQQVKPTQSTPLNPLDPGGIGE